MILKPVKIGDTVVPHGLFLAPMAGFTDLAFRELCHECGAEFSVTEMISAKAVCFGDKKTRELTRLTRLSRDSGFGTSFVETKNDPTTVPPSGVSPGWLYSQPAATALQLFGHEPEDIEKATRILLWEMCGGTPAPAGVDINMGCPVKKIVGNGEGSALMRDPALCGRIVEAAVRGAENFGVPVTVKIRAGFDSDHRNAPEVARVCASAGAAAIFVHGRTREQFYAPFSDNGIIAAVREAVPPEVPVIGNGDIVTPDDAERMLRETGCDGIMIGRAALGDPWLFGRIIAAGEGILLPEPTVDERIQMVLRLCRAVCERYGETRGVPMCRGRAGHFIKGIIGASAVRDRLCKAGTLAEVEECLGGMNNE